MNIGLDFDGTLVTCRQRHERVLRYACGVFGARVSVEGVWRRKRDGATTLAALVSAGVERPLATGIERCWVQEVESLHWLGFDRLLVLPALLSSLRTAGHSLHLVSARCNRPHLLQQLRLLGLSNCFDSVDIVGVENARMGKARSLAEHGVEVFIGDTELDFAAATEAGVEFAGVSSGMRSQEFLRRVGVRQVDALAMTYLRAYGARNWQA